MMDLSGTGISIVLQFNRAGGFGGTVIISSDDFSTDGQPLSFQDLRVGKVEIDLNGKALSWAEKQPVRMMLNLIPGSSSDESMLRQLYSSRNDEDNVTCDGEIQYPSGQRIKLTDGRVVSGLAGAGVDSSGKLIGGRYSIEFAGVQDDFSFGFNTTTLDGVRENLYSAS